jgi:cytochrome P450
MFDSFITNPYRTYKHLRAAAPLHWADKFRTGAWLVTRYADVMAGLHDPRLSFAKPEIEFMTDFANPLPALVFVA